MATDVKAELRNLPMAPHKVRLVIDLVRGESVNNALNRLQFLTKNSAKPVSKLIASAAANAEHNYGLNRETLYVHMISADEAPLRKWRRFGARGRFKPILRRSSHIKVVLREKA